MSTINFRAYKGYPMLQIIDNKNRNIQFVNTAKPEVGDLMEMFTANPDKDSPALVRTEKITEIIESRPPKGNHKDKKAVWHSVKY